MIERTTPSDAAAADIVAGDADHDFIILGAGLGGIGMAARLRAAGFTRFVVLEQAAGPGGTWRDNIYPGAACDTESHLYCYGFALHLDVSRLYARQPELLRYAERLIADQGLAPHIRYGQRIVAADWDASAGRWRIALATGATLTTRIFIPAWGQLNRPAVPVIAGQARFAGLAFHSARWPAGSICRAGASRASAMRPAQSSTSPRSRRWWIISPSSSAAPTGSCPAAIARSMRPRSRAMSPIPNCSVPIATPCSRGARRPSCACARAARMRARWSSRRATISPRRCPIRCCARG